MDINNIRLPSQKSQFRFLQHHDLRRKSPLKTPLVDKANLMSHFRLMVAELNDKCRYP